VNFEFVSKSFSSLSQGYTIFTFAIAAGGGDGASRLEAERHLLQTDGMRRSIPITDGVKLAVINALNVQSHEKGDRP
jgi:hypothetical protein